jgi:hypothetical protein
VDREKNDTGMPRVLCEHFFRGVLSRLRACMSFRIRHENSDDDFLLWTWRVATNAAGRPSRLRLS